MTDIQLTLKLAHIIGAAVLFGTGLSIAFFMLMAHRTRDATVIAHTAGVVVVADMIFTALAVLAQPLTGAALIHVVGYSWSEPWVVTSLALYVFTGLCWLPVVWIQLKLRDIASEAARTGTSLPPEYHQLFRAWFMLGWPAFCAVIVIFVVMIWKPQLW